jgi:hypothetical protein
MDRHLEKVFKIKDERQKIDLDDIRRLSKEADELGLARFVITGGEPLVMKISTPWSRPSTGPPLRHHRHQRLVPRPGARQAPQGHRRREGPAVPRQHDRGRARQVPQQAGLLQAGHARHRRLEAGLNLILSTVLVRGRGKSDEFRQMCEFAKRRASASTCPTPSPPARAPTTPSS